MTMIRNSGTVWPVLSLLLTATMWGVVWYPLRLLEEQGLSGVWSAAVSYGAALLLFLWVFVRDAEALRRNAATLVMMGLAAGWTNVAFILAVIDGNVVRVLLLFYLSPFWAVCLGWLVLGEKPDGRSLQVFLVAVVGAVIMLWNEEAGMPWPAGRADWLAVSAGFAFALTNVFVRHLHHVGVALKSVTSWASNVFVAVCWGLIVGVALPDVGPVVYGWAVLLGLCGFMVMTLAVVYGVSSMPVHRSAVILLFELVAGAISAQLLTSEIVLPHEWIGGGLIIIAAWLAARIHVGERDNAD